MPAVPEPVFRYPLSSADPASLDVVRGGVRRVVHRGRAGVLLTDVFGGIVLGPHHLEAPRGTLVLWVMALEDLHPAHMTEGQHLSVPDSQEFTLFSDRPTVKDSRASQCALVWTSHWTPALHLKRGPGHAYQAFKAGNGHATAGHFPFHGRRWYQLAYAWDAAAARHRLYANGVLVGANDAGATVLACPATGRDLCVGSTMFATGDVAGYADELDAGALAALYAAEATDRDPALLAELERHYQGRGLDRLRGDESAGWREDLALGLTDPGDLRQFLVQGCAEAPRITAEGLRITTTPKNPAHDFSILDLNHVYLWSRRWFEGDHLHLRYEFSNRRAGGLSLLMMQCSGMQREDAIACHRPRTNGTMKTVCWEDVRNYHWEYLREMDDVRNDLASHAMLKNPWQLPLGFAIHGPRYEPGSWHRLDWLQEGDRIRCAIDGDVVIDARDRPDIGQGPVLSGGRFAIRCMTRTDIVIRDLRVRSRPHLDG
ncbi:MAG: hypothetical protein RLZZ127_2676 [Planctomycetota bacterium]|jgi:hypothetical protein